MRLLRDFRCESCDTVVEKYIDSEAKVVQCECGKDAHRMVSAPRSALEGISGDFPGAHMRWATIREQNARIKAKQNS